MKKSTNGSLKDLRTARNHLVDTSMVDIDIKHALGDAYNQLDRSILKISKLDVNPNYIVRLEHAQGIINELIDRAGDVAEAMGALEVELLQDMEVALEEHRREVENKYFSRGEKQ